MPKGTLRLKQHVDISQKLEQQTLTLVSSKQDQFYRCYVLIGVPCSGKSHWADTIVRNWNRVPLPLIVGEDDVVTEECARSGESFHDVSNRMDPGFVYQEAMRRFRAAVGARRDVILDRHNLSEMDRAEILNFLPDYYQKIAVVFTQPQRVIHDRLTKRYEETGRPYSPHVVQNMIKRLERPADMEFDRITTIDHLCRY